MQNFIKYKCVLTKNDDNYAVAPCDLTVALTTHLPIISILLIQGLSLSDIYIYFSDKTVIPAQKH